MYSTGHIDKKEIEQPKPRKQDAATPTTGWKVPEDLLEWAWTIIANAHGVDWDKESSDWRDAAMKWRDSYFGSLPRVPKNSSEQPNTSRPHDQPKPTGEKVSGGTRLDCGTFIPPKPTTGCDCEGYNEDGRLICNKERGHDTDLPMPTTGENMIWNGDCKVEGCERECVDSSGYCKKHKPTKGAPVGWEAQPKPWGDPPKPTTGEWTAESVRNFFTCGTHLESCEDCAKAINAALDAAIEKATKPLVDALKRLLNEGLKVKAIIQAKAVLAKVKEGQS